MADGEKQWRWLPLRCQGQNAEGETCGDVDDYDALFGRAWILDDYHDGDPVYVVDAETGRSGPGSEEWFARAGVMRKRVLVADQETRGRGRRQDKLVLSLQECKKPRTCGVVQQVQ